MSVDGAVLCHMLPVVDEDVDTIVWFESNCREGEPQTRDTASCS